MELGPQCRLLARQSAAAVSAGQHRSGLSLRNDQRRRAAEQLALAALVHEAADPATEALPGLRPRHAGVSLSQQSQGAGVHPPVPGRASTGGCQSLALYAVCRTRSVSTQGCGAGGNVWTGEGPGHYRESLPALAWPACLLLVPSATA